MCNLSPDYGKSLRLRGLIASVDDVVRRVVRRRAAWGTVEAEAEERRRMVEAVARGGSVGGGGGRDFARGSHDVIYGSNGGFDNGDLDYRA
jgi:hypothetical protein